MSIALLTFSPFTAFADGLTEMVYNSPSMGMLQDDVLIISEITGTVKLYYSPNMESIVAELEKQGMHVLIGINMKSEYGDLNRYIEIANAHPNVKGIILEDDMIDFVTEEKVIELAEYVESKGIAVGVAQSRQL